MSLAKEAENLTLHQFETSPNLKALVKNLITPFQQILEQIEKLNLSLDTAFGKTLDIFGAITGHSRNGLSDTNFTEWIKVAIKLNTGGGTAENVFTILRILYQHKPNFLMYEYHPNHIVFVLLSLPQTPFDTLLNIIASAVPITTKCHFIRADKEPTFRFDNTNFSNSHFAEFLKENF